MAGSEVFEVSSKRMRAARIGLAKVAAKLLYAALEACPTLHRELHTETYRRSMEKVRASLPDLVAVKIIRPGKWEN